MLFIADAIILFLEKFYIQAVSKIKVFYGKKKKQPLKYNF